MLTDTIAHIPQRIAGPATDETLSHLSTAGMPATTLTFVWGPHDDEVTITEDVRYHLLRNKLVIQGRDGDAIEVDRNEIEHIFATRKASR